MLVNNFCHSFHEQVLSALPCITMGMSFSWFFPNVEHTFLSFHKYSSKKT